MPHHPTFDPPIRWADSGVIVYTSDPTHAYAGDGTVYDVTRSDGDHCSVTNNELWIGCSLPVGHDGPHLPTARELLRDGVRLTVASSPAPSRPLPEREQT